MAEPLNLEVGMNQLLEQYRARLSETTHENLMLRALLAEQPPAEAHAARAAMPPGQPPGTVAVT
jgi:hypothetical protein